MELAENINNSQIPRERSKFKWEYLAAFTCTLLLFCFGASTGWYSPSLAKLLTKESPITLSTSTASWLASVSGIAMVIAPPFAVFIVDRIGPHKSLLIASLPFVMSWILIASATTAATLFVARFSSGISSAIAISVIPIYLGEISSTRLRGTAGMMGATMFNLGTIFVFAVAPHISISNMAWINLAGPIIFIVSFWKMPESPYFLASNRRVEKAEAELVKLRGKTHVTEELDSIVKFTTLRHNAPDGDNVRRSIVKKSCFANWFDLLFCTPSNRKGMFILLMMGASHHFGGFFPLQIWAQLIFKKIGNVDIAAENAAIVMMIMRLVSGITATFVADRVNRRTLYAISGFLAILCTITLFLYFLANEVFYVDVSAYSYIGVGAAILYTGAISMGVMPLTAIVMSEIFTTDGKSKASCLYTMYCGAIGGLAIKLFMVFSTWWGYYSSFALYSVVLAVTTAGVIVLLPETRGKTFAEIQIALGNVNASQEHEDEKTVLKKC